MPAGNEPIDEPFENERRNQAKCAASGYGKKAAKMYVE